MGTDTAESLLAHDLEERQATYRRWCDTVRDPAKISTEGLREVEADNVSAVAQYEIAELPSGAWAVRVRCEYRCGNYSGIGTPWTEFPSRDHCIVFFRATARRHFRHDSNHVDSPKQRSAQVSINERLADGLFGFIEPTPLSG
jgi:hypothetical protein